MFGFGYYESFIVLLPAMIFAMIASSKVKSTYQKYAKIKSSRGLTGAEVARRILNAVGLYDIRVEPVAGAMTDHYSSKGKVIRLSEGVFNSNSIAALSIAAHECGHAIQHQEAYAFLAIRELMFPVVNFSGKLAMPIAMVGIFISYMSEVVGFGLLLLQIGIILFTVVVLFQLVTLPVEFNASRRAIVILRENNYLDDREIGSARKMLNAAAMTYVAAAATAMASLLRLILISRGRRK